jgi:hypothetical protein
MGNCGGRSSYENIMDDFFLELNITHFNNNELEILISNNVINNKFCDNKLEIFKSNLSEYFKSFSEDPDIRTKTSFFWEKSFSSFLDSKNQFYLLCCVLFLCKYEKNSLHLTISKFANFMNYDIDYSNFILQKEQLKELLTFYFYFITVFALDVFNQSDNEKEVFNPTMLIVYKESNRKVLIEEILKNYEEKVSLENFLKAEMDNLFHVSVRKMLNEIHLKSD